MDGMGSVLFRFYKNGAGEWWHNSGVPGLLITASRKKGSAYYTPGKSGGQSRRRYAFWFRGFFFWSRFFTCCHSKGDNDRRCACISAIFCYFLRFPSVHHKPTYDGWSTCISEIFSSFLFHQQSVKKGDARQTGEKSVKRVPSQKLITTPSLSLYLEEFFFLLTFYR